MEEEIGFVSEIHCTFGAGRHLVFIGKNKSNSVVVRSFLKD